jgi:hypothetical protein
MFERISKEEKEMMIERGIINIQMTMNRRFRDYSLRRRVVLRINRREPRTEPLRNTMQKMKSRKPRMKYVFCSLQSNINSAEFNISAQLFDLHHLQSR